MQPEQLTPTELIAVSVPVDAKEIHFGNHCLGFKSNAKHDIDTNGWCIISMGLFAIKKFAILGTITANEIDFDPSVMQFTGLGYEKDKEYCYKLLSANGLHFTNPYQKHECILKCDFGEEEVHACLGAKTLWTMAENNLIEKLVILKKI